MATVLGMPGTKYQLADGTYDYDGDGTPLLFPTDNSDINDAPTAYGANNWAPVAMTLALPTAKALAPRYRRKFNQGFD